MDTRVRNYHKTLIELAFEPIFVREFNGRILEWNHGAQELYGYSQDEAVGAVSHDLLQTRFPASRSELEKILECDNRWRGELIHTGKDGQRIAVESSQQLYTLTDGARVVLEVNRVIHPTRSEFHLLFENMREGIAYFRTLRDREGHVVDAVFLETNPALEKLIGATDLVGRRVSELFPDLAGQYLVSNAMYDRVVQTGQPETTERYVPALRKWVHVSAFSPKTEHVVVIGEDVTGRKQTEAALRESELRHRMIFEHATTGIAVTDWDGRFESCNPAYCALLGYSEDELRKMDFASLVHPEDRTENLSLIQRIKRGELEHFEIQNRYVRKDGELVWVRKFGYTLPDRSGKPSRLAALVTDITERVQTEAMLRRERDYTQRLVDTVPAIVLLLGPEGHIQHVNRYFETLTGYTLEEIRGKNWFDTFLPERDRERIRTLFHTAVTDIPTHGNINPIVLRNGSEREIEWFDQRITEAGKPSGLLAIGMEVTGRLAAERARTEAMARLRLALDGGEMGTWEWDLATDRLVWDRREHELFGIDEHSFTGEGEEAMRHLHPDDRERISLEVSRAVFDSKPFREEFRVLRADGSVRWLAGRAQPIPNEHGKITRIIGVNFDITTRKEADEAREHRHEEELARLYRIGTVNELAGGLAHELSQPLTAIQNYAGGCIKVLTAGGSTDQLLNALQAINEQSHRVVDIIQHLRRLMVTGEPQRTLADLTTLVTRARDLLKVPLARKNIKVTVEVEPALPAVYVDALQIEQVLIILLRNSIDAFTGEYLAHPSIHIRLRCHGDTVTTEVTDNGPGVPPDQLERLFQPFYTTKSHGTGLGLMLAHSLIKAHQGHIRALQSGTHGLTVWFTLPIGDAVHG